MKPYIELPELLGVDGAGTIVGTDPNRNDEHLEPVACKKVLNAGIK